MQEQAIISESVNETKTDLDDALQQLSQLIEQDSSVNQIATGKAFEGFDDANEVLNQSP